MPLPRTCCANCQGDNPRLCCAVCMTKYCSPDCQRAHWKMHKRDCSKMGEQLGMLNHMKAAAKDKNRNANERLFAASYVGRLGECERLIDEEAADVNFLLNDDKNASCLHVAAVEGHTRIITLLISRGARTAVFTIDGMSPLYAAAKFHREQAIQTLLENGAEVDLHNNNEAGDTPCIFAAQIGSTSILEILINAGAVPDRPNRNGVCALYYAAQNGHSAVVQLLVAAGAVVDRIDPTLGATALHAASRGGHTAVAELLVAAGAVVDLPERNGGATALRIAAYLNNAPLVEILLRHGAVVGRISNGITILHMACDLGHKSVVEALLRNGADPLFRSEFGTPLDVAISKNHTAIVELLKARIAVMAREAKEGRA